MTEYVTDAHQVLVRMPNELHLAIKASADANERTVAQEVRYAMRQYLAARGAA